MALSADDEELLAAMKQREFNLKKRQRAANAIYQETSRYRTTLVAITAFVVAVLLTAACVVVATTSSHSTESLAKQAITTGGIGLVVGALLGHGWMHTPHGRRLLARKEVRLNDKYSGDLHAGRRWLQFFYRGEDISAYVAQILYLIESEHRFDSVDEALTFAKAHAHERTRFRSRGLELFNEIVAQTNLVVVSSSDSGGCPSVRYMRFVRSDRPGIWYVTTAPDAPKVHEFDDGRVAIITAPTETGATVSSNQVRVRRADKTFHQIADLYRAQAPRYLDGMSEDDQRCELVYELSIESAKVESWVDRDVVVFDRADRVG